MSNYNDGGSENPIKSRIIFIIMDMNDFKKKGNVTYVHVESEARGLVVNKQRKFWHKRVS